MDHTLERTTVPSTGESRYYSITLAQFLLIPPNSHSDRTITGIWYLAEHITNLKCVICNVSVDSWANVECLRFFRFFTLLVDTRFCTLLHGSQI